MQESQFESYYRWSNKQSPELWGLKYCFWSIRHQMPHQFCTGPFHWGAMGTSLESATFAKVLKVLVQSPVLVGDRRSPSAGGWRPSNIFWPGRYRMSSEHPSPSTSWGLYKTGKSLVKSSSLPDVLSGRSATHHRSLWNKPVPRFVLSVFLCLVGNKTQSTTITLREVTSSTVHSCTHLFCVVVVLFFFVYGYIFGSICVTGRLAV